MPTATSASKTGRNRQRVISLTGSENGTTLHPPDDGPVMYSREDWTQFRDRSKLPAVAGVKAGLLPRVAVKELVDNALDAAASPGGVRIEPLAAPPGEVRFAVVNDGPGIPGDDAAVAELFSIRRPMTSSKSVRLPTRGMLGNGLRVVAGVVRCADGELRVSTAGRTLTLVPRDDGSTAVTHSEPWLGSGTRVEVVLRGTFAGYAAADPGYQDWGLEAIGQASHGSPYKGSSSAYWYGSGEFWELVQAAGKVRVERFVAETFDGYSDRARAAAVCDGLAGRECRSITRVEAAALLNRMKATVSKVSGNRLRKLGNRKDEFAGYGIIEGVFSRDGAEVPFVVEAWANRTAAKRPAVLVCVNRTPVVTEFTLQREGDRTYFIHGGGLGTTEDCFRAPAKRTGEFRVVVNVTAPFVPIVSSGKDPDLTVMRQAVLDACEKAVARAKRRPRQAGEKAVNLKELIRNNLAEAAQVLSGGGSYLFSLRQLYYFIRPIILKARPGEEPDYGYFSKVVGEYDDDLDDLPGLYRDDRGILYHPHTREVIPLGTRSVAAYRRPAWWFNKLLYCEKEGMLEQLKHTGWLERHDCAFVTSKGFATRAARDLIALLGGSTEFTAVYCIHDADGPGTVIYDSLRKVLGERGITVIDLGLNPKEAREMGLEVEKVNRKDGKRVPTGSGLPPAEQEWLQKNHIELNAMPPSRLEEWLTQGVAKHDDIGKVVPPADVVAAELAAQARAALFERIKEKVLREANVEGQVADAMRGLEPVLSRETLRLAVDLVVELNENPDQHWTHAVEETAGRLVGVESPDA